MIIDLSDNRVREFQNLFEKEYGKKLSFAEARESAQKLVGFYEILYEIEKIDHQRKQRLEKEPGGFHIDGTYNCFVCLTPFQTPKLGMTNMASPACFVTKHLERR